MIKINNKHALMINLLTMVFTLVINILVNFYLSRYIIDAIGESAYGFVSLANNFVSYATIFTTALNSMASRFITLSIHKNQKKDTNEFFSSVLIANVLIVLFLILPSIFIVYYLQYIIKIPTSLIIDVKLLFMLLFINFYITLVNGVFSVATYCKNKLYLSSLRTFESTVLKVIIIIFLFILFNPSVFYIGIATIISTIYILLFNIKYTKRFLPDVKINKKYFSIKKIKILVFSGLWNSITNLGNVIADGLDLIISNLAINPSTMGIVAVAKVPSAAFNTIISNIMTVFQPRALEFYAKNDMENTKKEIIKAMKISGVFGNIPFCFIVVFGAMFCSLWMPSVELKQLVIICIISFVNVYSGGLVGPLYNVFTITNRVKLNALLCIISALISTILVLILVKYTNLGVYAIVGVSAIVGLIKGFLIVPIFAAKSLNAKALTFFPTILRYFISTIIMLVVFYAVSKVLIIKTWSVLFLAIVICGILGLIVDILILLKKEDLYYVKELIYKKFNKTRRKI